MKKCPYCYELIQNDAKKCKHCGEWIKSKVESLLSKTKNAIEEKKEARKAKQNAHLFIPTEQQPLELENIKFYPERVLIDEKEISYDKIRCVEYFSSITTINFSSRTEIRFAIHYTNANSQEERILFIGDIEKGIINRNTSNKVKEQLSFISNYISKKTYLQRLKKYVWEIQNKGYFRYKNSYPQLEGYNFYTNGDISHNGRILGNIKDEYNKGELIWGLATTKGYRSSSSNPYLLSFKNRNAKWFQWLDKTVFINSYYDKDIFDSMIISFLNRGTFLPEEKQ